GCLTKSRIAGRSACVTAAVTELQQRIEALFSQAPSSYKEREIALFDEFLALLNQGALRAAEPDVAAPTGWRVNSWVKKGILLGFRIGALVDMSPTQAGAQFFDK